METELNMGFKVFPVEPSGFPGIRLQQVKAEVTATTTSVVGTLSLF